MPLTSLICHRSTLLSLHFKSHFLMHIKQHSCYPGAQNTIHVRDTLHKCNIFWVHYGSIFIRFKESQFINIYSPYPELDFDFTPLPGPCFSTSGRSTSLEIFTNTCKWFHFSWWRAFPAFSKWLAPEILNILQCVGQSYMLKNSFPNTNSTLWDKYYSRGYSRKNILNA